VLALLGLKDDYRHQGRVLAEVLDRRAVRGLGDVDAYLRLAAIYKQLNAPVGQFGLATLRASTAALESGRGPEDSTYTRVTQQLTDLGTARDSLAAQMAEVLDRPVSKVGPDRDRDAGAPRALGDRGEALLLRAWLTAGQ